MTSTLAMDERIRHLVEQSIQDVLPQVTEFRRERHQQPDLTWQEQPTALAVLAKLRAIPGLQIQEGIGRHGIVALLEGAHSGPVIGLRADMDALPVTEATGCAWASKRPGVMHACGHDGHMANLFGAALVLSRLRPHLRGRVKFIFQPAEEGGAGAREMCDDGALKNPDVDVIFGLHGWPELPAGHVGVRAGALLAATGELRITIRGTGCHAAMPHLGTDQVLIAARIIEGIQAISARRVAPTEPVAVTITKVAAGTAVNVIPAEVVLEGTIRAMSREVHRFCQEEVRRIAGGIAAAHGVTAEVAFKEGYPATINDSDATAFIEAVGRAVLPSGALSRLPAPTMGGEDFAFFLERARGSYFFIGVSDGRPGGYPSLHHPGYDFNDNALPNGMRMFVHAALSWADWSGRTGQG